MSLVRAKYRSNHFAEMIGENTNNGTASVAMLQFCSTMVRSEGIEKISNSSVKISEGGLYEMSFPLSVKANSGLNYYVDIGVNGTYTQIALMTLTANFSMDTYHHILPLNAGDIVEIRIRLSASSANFKTNCSCPNFNTANDNTIIPTSTIKKI